MLAFGLLYLETATNIVIALDPASGTALALRSAHRSRAPLFGLAARGVSVWQDGDPKDTGPCSRRIFTGTLDARLIALDAATGGRVRALGRADRLI